MQSAECILHGEVLRQDLAEKRLDGVGHAHHSHIGRVRAIDRPFAVVAEQIVAFDIAQTRHALFEQFFIDDTKRGAFVRVIPLPPR